MRQLRCTLLAFVLSASSAVLMAAPASGAISEGAVMRGDKINYSNAPAKKWQDALVSGNGEMGVMLFGNPAHEQIILNHEMLYEFMGTEDAEPPFIANVMPETKQLIKEGKYKEAKALTIKEAIDKGHKEILWTDPYHPACALMIEQEFAGEVSRYIRRTNYSSGEVSVDWRAGGVDYRRSFFVSRPANIIAGMITASKGGKVNATFGIDDLIDQAVIDNNARTKVLEGNVKAVNPKTWEQYSSPFVTPQQSVAQGEWLTYRVKYQVYDRGYEVVVCVKNHGGSLLAKGQNVEVEGADNIEVLAKIIPLEEFTHSAIESAQRELSAAKSYSALLAEHRAEHGEMVGRVELKLDKRGFKDGSNEELLAMQKESEDVNPYLLEKMFNMGLYTLVSSSGNNPPNLMGIWNGEWRPTWSGDFTLDANVNLQIAGANLANQREAIDSYMKLLERISEDWEVNAFKLHGCRGYYAGTRTSGRRGLCTHFLNFPGHYWTAGAEWLLLPCFDYYLCSGDKEFLRERLFPMMEKVALFYEDFLDTYDYNGKYLFAPSYSPENWAVLPNGTRESAIANSTIDIAAAKEALNNIIWVCEKEGIDHKKLPLWKSMLEKMPPYLINEDGALKEWSREDLGDYYDHRHVSHMYPVWPGSEITAESGALYDAAKVAIDKRGRGDGSAHGLIITALIASRLKMPELVYGNLRYIFTKNYIFNSLFTSHNPNWGVYNADAINCLPAIVMEMLVYSRPGVVELIPALSDKLAKGSISGVMCRTQAKVEMLEWDMKKREVEATISSQVAQTLEISLRKDIKRVMVDGKSVSFEGDTVSLEFAAGESREIEFSWK